MVEDVWEGEAAGMINARSETVAKNEGNSECLPVGPIHTKKHLETSAPALVAIGPFLIVKDRNPHDVS